MKFGIDCYTGNGYPDFKKLGADFAMIKATQGRSEVSNSKYFTDPKFEKNIKAAHDAGIKIGVYHYLTAKTEEEAKYEADLFLSAIKKHSGKITIGAACDVESRHLPDDKSLLTKIVCAFCDRVKFNGFDPIVYTNPSFLKFRLNDISKYPLWLALWRDKKAIPTKEQYPNLKIWQYGTEKINGTVYDCNYLFDDSETAFEWAVKKKFISGKSKINDSVTIGTMCEMIHRLYDDIGGIKH